MKHIGLFALIVLLSLGACVKQAEVDSGKIRVITTLFVLYDVAREIGGEYVTASLLIPPGVEAHSWEPSPRDIIRIREANVFLHAGLIMDPWAERISGAVANPALTIADASQGITLLRKTDEQNAATETDPDANSPFDPHFWLDPLRTLTMTATIRDALSKADPAHAAFYSERARLYSDKLTALDREIKSVLAGRKASTIIFGGHNTFGYFGARYGLTFLSPYAGFSPDAEPQARRLTELVALMKKLGLSVIYHEENIDPKVARVIAGETGARLVLLHGAHNVSKDELDAGVTYLSIMEDNLKRLKQDPGLFY
jgi:zinc transport system substrate-binding protein